MSLPVAAGSGLGRFARSSEDYVSDIVSAKRRLGGRKLSAREKQAKLAHILSDKTGGIQRLGQSMIGPIQLQLRYQGILRNVLLEDTLTPGVPIFYDVLDDLGQAYFLHGNQGEIKITPFEGKRVEVQLFRIASFPQVKKEDLYYLRSNIVEYTQDMTKQAIMRQEDSRLITLLEAAAVSYRARAHCRTRSRSPVPTCSPTTSTRRSPTPTSVSWIPRGCSSTRRNTGTSTGGTSTPPVGRSRIRWLLVSASCSSVSSRSANPSSSRVVPPT
jgi:hypothetical protein